MLFLWDGFGYIDHDARRSSTNSVGKLMHGLNRNILTVTLGLLMCVVNAQGQAKVKFDDKDSAGAAALFPLEDVRPGMKGVARTVFSGSQPEEFGVEILGVLDGFTGPRQSTI